MHSTKMKFFNIIFIRSFQSVRSQSRALLLKKFFLLNANSVIASGLKVCNKVSEKKVLCMIYLMIAIPKKHFVFLS